ncbi:chemotaxis protein CheW [Chlorogloeopsis sp. ULAP02]|uniref:chemotaxis protein CheW n=1 Tax=Chlorogloeopsis sp. ULAP02 TaxID=3107926 RepID=UPI003135C269
MSLRQKFLSFNLGTKGIAVIALQNITEILQVSLTEICCIPQMHSSVFGTYNWRGNMLWLVNLEEMLGYIPLQKEVNLLSKMIAIVVNNEDKYLGLLVRQIMDIEQLDANNLKPTNSELFSPDISHLLHGYFINDREEMIINLNANAILQSPMWDIHN